MRGLRPPPNGTFAMRYGFACFHVHDLPATPTVRNARAITTTHHFFVSTLDTYSPAQLQRLADDVTFWFLELFTSVANVSVQMTEARWTAHTPTPLTGVRPIEPNHGAWPSFAPLNAALVIYFADGTPGRSGHAVSYIPGFPDDFSDDGIDLNSDGFIAVQDALSTYLAGLAGIVTPDASPLLPVVLHRAADGAPLEDPYVSPVVEAFPSTKVGTLRRRVRSSGRISPS